MNGLPLPQLTGLVDGSYASTTPLMVNGVLAEIRFTALGACQTNLTLESAALAIRTAEGFAAPLAGVTIGEKNVALMVSAEKVEAQAVQPETGSTLSLEPPAAKSGISGWVVGLVILLIFGGIGVAAWQFLRSTKTDTQAKQRTPQSTAAVLHMKMGPQAGKSITLNKLPVLIGRDPQNDICLNDPHVIGQHARIFANNNTFYLMDLGGETVINGKSIQKSSVILKPGDVIRLGKRSLFVFG
jgi:hypothetical protein